MAARRAASHSQLYSYKSVGIATPRLTQLVKMFTTVPDLQNSVARIDERESFLPGEELS